jgi:hypothetical protein
MDTASLEEWGLESWAKEGVASMVEVVKGKGVGGLADSVP